jgi:hypothetical protein
MDGSGVIHLHIRPPRQPAPESTLDPVVPLPAPREQLGYGELDIDRLNPHYDDLLGHLGGLSPGEVKAVMPWHAQEEWHYAFDPARGSCPMHHLLPDAFARR